VFCHWSFGRGVGGFWSEKDLRKARTLEWRKSASGWKGIREEGRTQECRMWRRLPVAEATFGKINVAEDPSWTLGNVDFLGKILGIRDMSS